MIQEYSAIPVLLDPTLVESSHNPCSGLANNKGKPSKLVG